mgnify:CR=1 FL=1
MSIPVNAAPGTAPPAAPPASAASRAPGIGICFAFLLGIAVPVGVLGRSVPAGDTLAIPLGLGAAVIAGAIIPGPTRRLLICTLTSLPFAVALLALVLLATILGTLILQGLPPEAYARHYGGAVAPILLGLGLNDLFHASWYAAWLVLLAAALVLVAVRRKTWRPPQWGHGLAHLGVVLILAGALAGVREGFKGHIDLHEGQSTDAALPVSRAGAAATPRPLGFSLRLDDFDVEHYPPEPKFVVYERQGNSFKPRKAIKLKDAGAWTAIGSGGASFRWVRRIEASRRESESHVLLVQRDATAPPEEIPVTPDATVPLPGGAWRVRVLGYYPDFVIDTETRKPASRSPHPNNPALQVEVLPTGGGPGRKQWLFARMPEFDHGGGEGAGPRLRYRYLPAEIPAQVEVEVRSPEGEGTHRFAEREAEPLQLPDGRTILAYERKTEVKEYRSRLSVLEGGRTVREKTIEVNDPLTWRGWSFYQSNYREEDPTYSGIQVVRDPGLPLVWAGLLMMCAGLVYIYYVRPRMTRTREGLPPRPEEAS